MIGETRTEVNDDSKDLLPIFWDLASINEEKRVKRVVDLISILKGKEDDMNEKGLPEELTYTIKRLVKGSGSSRGGARQGFGTALAEILKTFVQIKFDVIYELMDEHLSVKGSFEAQEERDALFGQAFCHAALIQAMSSDVENYYTYVKRTTHGLLVLMKKKSYLLELCTKLIVDLMEKVDQMCFVKKVFPILKDDLKEGWDGCTPEKLCILLAIERMFKESVGIAYFENSWKCSKVFRRENMEGIGKILMESTINSHPRMHLVWNEVFPHILRSSKILKAFWITVIEEGLMQSTHERKFLAFNVLKEMLAKIPKSQVEIVISSNLLKSIINSCNSEKNYLYTASRNMLACIASQVAKNENDGVALAVINEIFKRSGAISFDALTKTKTIESLIGQLDASSVLDFIAWLKKIFSKGKVEEILDDDESDNIEKVSQNRKWAASQMLTVVRRIHLPKDEKWLLDIAKFLFFNGYFHSIKNVNKSELCIIHDPPLDGSVSGLCRERFLGTLSELSTIHQLPEESVKGKAVLHSIPGALKNGDYYAYELVNFAKGLLQDSKHVALNKEWTPETKEVFNEALELVEKIREKVPRDSPMCEDRAFELLFVHSCLQMFDKTTEAADAIQELIQCYKKLKEKKKRKKLDEEPHWSEVLTEILLSFLTQSSHMMRQIVNMVFTIIVPDITPTAFQLIVEALRPKKNSKESNLEIVDESDEDIEMEELEVESGDEDDDDENDGDKYSSEDSETDSDDDDTVDEAFRSEVKIALGNAAVPSDEDVSDNEEDDSDVDMDTVDSKVLNAMDKALAATFRVRMQARSGKKKREEEKKTVIHFRLRVLDIAELIVKKQPKSPFILDLIEPLLEVVKVSSMYQEEKELHNRAQAILNNRICHSREIPNAEDLDKEKLHDKIEHLMKLGQNASSMQMVNLITHICMYLIRVLRGRVDIKEPSPLKTRGQRRNQVLDENNETEAWGSLNCQRIVAIYENALKDFMTRRNSHLQPIIFMELIKRYPGIAWKLSGSLAVYLSTAVNNFRKVQACEMMLQLLARKSDCKKENFKDMSTPLQQELIKVFKQACDVSFGMKAKHLHEIAKLTDRFIKENRANFKLPFADELADSIENALGGPIIQRSPQLLAYCKRIIALLSENPELDSGIENRKRTSRPAELVKKDGINGQTESGTVEEKNNKTLDFDTQIVKKKKKKKSNDN